MSSLKRVPGIMISCLLIALLYPLFGVSQEKRRIERPERLERPEGPERLERPEKPERLERQGSPNYVRKEAPLDGTFKLLWSKLSPEFRRIVKGAPYSATAITEHTQTLSDGNQIIRKSETAYYRDSEGRIRTEQKLEAIGNLTAAGEVPHIIMIGDPVVGRNYTLDTRAHTVRVDTYALVSEGAIEKQKREAEPRPAKLPTLEPEKEKAKAAAKAEKANTAPKAYPPPEMPQPLIRKEVPSQERKKETLGTQIIEGVQAEGTRSIVTIPAGEIGNTLPIQIVDESWYSPELQVRVMSRHSDPRSGETVFRLININRSEPNRSLFEVPADYTITSNESPSKPRPKN